VSNFQPAATPSPGDIEREAHLLSSRPGGFGGLVRDLLPEFPAYARVFHRPGSTTWASIAAANGKVAHPTMQWGCIQSGDHDEAPAVGRIDAAIVEALARALGPRQLFAAIWVGWGQDDPWIEGPAAYRPQREYVVMTGEWSTFTADWSDFSAPNTPPAFLWDAGHGWMTSTEIDLDSTVIGGDDQLIAAILSDATVEAWPVGPSDSLQFNGDRLNC
jgi:hypothetical protein